MSLKVLSLIQPDTIIIEETLDTKLEEIKEIKETNLVEKTHLLEEIKETNLVEEIKETLHVKLDETNLAEEINETEIFKVINHCCLIS